MARLLPRSDFIYKHYIAILVVATLASVIGGYFSSKLSLQSDLAELLPDTFESVKALNRIKEQVGGVGHLRIIVETKDFRAAKEFAHHLEPKLLASPLINYIDYKNDAAFYKENALLYLEMVELDSLQLAIQDKIDSEKQKLNPLFVDDLFGDEEEDTEDDDLAKWERKYEDKEPKEYYTNGDSTVIVIKAFPVGTNTNLKFVRKLFNEVKQIVEASNPKSFAPDLEILYGGNFKNRLDDYEVIKSDILGTAYYGIGGVFLLIVIYFRRLSGAVLITITLLFSLCWTFALTYWVIGNLNTITGFLFVILFGLGIDYGIHAFARYTESRRSGLGVEQSIEKLIGQTGKALLTTAVTTSAAFFSLMLMDFRGFSDLGFIAGVGMLFALVAMVIVLPAFITLFEKLKWLKIPAAESKTRNFQRRDFRFSRPILLLSGFITLFAAYSFVQIEFEYDFTNLRAITEERKIVSKKTKGVFSLSESPAVILADSRTELNAIVDAIKTIIENDTLSPTVEAVRSVFSLVPENQEEKLAKIKEIRELVEDEAEGVLTGPDKDRLEKLNQYLQVKKPFVWEDLPEKDRRQFIDKQGKIGNFVFIYPSVPLRDGTNAIEFRNDIGKIVADGKTYIASSSNIILAEMLLIMIREGRLAVILSFLIVFLLVFLDFRSLKATLLVLTPLALGLLWMGVIMFLFGIKLNFFNIVVLPSVIGIGVDNGVHIYHRYKEEGPGSLYFVLKNTGLAVVMTTLTTIVGYSGLILARHPGLNSIGDLAVIGISSAFVTAVVVLPALLQFFDARIGQSRPLATIGSTASQSGT